MEGSPEEEAATQHKSTFCPHSLPVPPPPPPSSYQNENNEAEEKDDQNNGVDNREPVNLELFWEEGLQELLTITICYPAGDMAKRREGGGA